MVKMNFLDNYIPTTILLKGGTTLLGKLKCGISYSLKKEQRLIKVLEETSLKPKISHTAFIQQNVEIGNEGFPGPDLFYCNGATGFSQERNGGSPGARCSRSFPKLFSRSKAEGNVLTILHP